MGVAVIMCHGGHLVIFSEVQCVRVSVCMCGGEGMVGRDGWEGGAHTHVSIMLLAAVWMAWLAV